jgi:cysteine-rich repeat protein
MRTTWLAAALALAVLAPASRSAHAFIPQPDIGGYVAARPSRSHVAAAWTTPARAAAAFDRLVADTGAWKAVWDADTDVPIRLYGAGIAAPGANADPAIALAAARAVIDAHLDLLAPGASAADLVVVGNAASPQNGLRTVTLAQEWNGLRVFGARITAVFKRDRLIVLGSSALPDVSASIPSTVAPPPTTRARQWIAADTQLAEATLAVADSSPPVIFAEVRTRTGAAPDIAYTVARPIGVEATGGTGKWTVWIDAATGEPLARASRFLFATGTLTYNTPERTAVGPRAEVAVPFAGVSVDGVLLTTGHGGALTWPTEAAATVITSVTGPFINVIDDTGHPLASATLTLAPGGTASFGVPTDEFADAQITVFTHSNVAKAVIRRELNPFLGWVDQQMTVLANQADHCNAFAELEPDTTRFFTAGNIFGTDCENTARIPDVAYHETGHNYHYRSLLANGLVSSRDEFLSSIDILSLSEGLGDSLAVGITLNPVLGPGFFIGDPNGIRNLDPPGVEKRYPDDLTGESHANGEIIGGTTWDLRTALRTELGDLRGGAIANRVIDSIAAHSTSFPSTYVDALAGDDDDGNLLNGTPNKCAISKAFVLHGLASETAGGVVIGTPSIDAGVLSLPITVPPAECPALAVTGATATWRVRGDASQTGTITLAAAGATWTGAVPVLPDGTVLEYQVTVTFSDASTVTRPINPAAPYYEAYVGAVTAIRCDDFEADPGWTHAATSGPDEWARGVGGAAPASGDPTGPFGGAGIFGTDIEDNGLYAAAGDSHAETPAVDTTGYATVRLQYRRWLDVDDGFFDQATITAGGTEVWSNPAGTDAGSATNLFRDGEWRFHDVDLTAAAAGGSVAVQFGLVADAQTQYGGWALDDVCIVGVGATCGDMLVRGAEQCDDGNVEDGDGCDATCAMEPPDSGGCCSTGTDPRGALAATAFGALGLLVVLRRRRR